MNASRASTLFAGRAGVERAIPDVIQDRLATARSRSSATLVAMTGAVRLRLLAAGDSRSRGSISGIGQLGDFVRLMLPPDPGTGRSCRLS